MPPKLRDFLQRWLINAVAVMVAASIVPGISYDNFPTLLVAALLLGILNTFLRPLLLLLALPLLVLTLGLFYFVINALLLMLVSSMVQHFHVGDATGRFWPAFWGALVITIMTMLLNALTGANRSRMNIRYQRGAPPPRRDDDDHGPVIDV